MYCTSSEILSSLYIVEELILQKDLSVRFDGDDISWEEAEDRHVTSLGPNDREGSQGATSRGISNLDNNNTLL